jgi:hypothetical protein
MLARLGPFYIFQIGEALARLPGRIEVDPEEARRITDDIGEWYLRGEFRDDEVFACAGDPPSLRSLAEIKEDSRRRGEIWRLTQPIWRAGYMLTASALRRYLEGCGLSGAARVSSEWFGAIATPTVEAAKSNPSAPNEKQRRKPGPKPELRDTIARKMLTDLRSGRFAPEELKAFTLVALEAEYGGSQNTAKVAREDALARFAELQNSDAANNPEQR